MNGTFLQLDPSVSYFKITHPRVGCILETATDGTPLIIVYKLPSMEVITSIQHHTILLHPRTLTMLWTSVKGTNTEKPCQCVRFDSRNVFQIFERATASLRRLHSSSMVQQSILLEFKVQKIENFLNPATASNSRTPAPSILSHRSRLNSSNNNAALATNASIPTTTNESENKNNIIIPEKTVTPESECVVCNVTGNNLKLHSNVSSYSEKSRGAVYICEKCNQTLIKNERHRKDDLPLCAVCGKKGDSNKTCQYKDCKNSYCPTCIESLYGTKELKDKGVWFCVNCKHYSKKKSNVKTLDKIDYFAKYVKFIIGREDGSIDSSESEDVCFACKDGGSLIECDWNGPKKKKVKRCSKVYHEYCLGFEIPEDLKKWVCPTHHCVECAKTGNLAVSCRFCPQSYCKAHVPKTGITFIYLRNYIMCKDCTGLHKTAVSRGLLKPMEGLEEEEEEKELAVPEEVSTPPVTGIRQSIRCATIKSLTDVGNTTPPPSSTKRRRDEESSPPSSARRRSVRKK